MFHLKLLIIFLLLINCRVKLTGTPTVPKPTHPAFEAKWIRRSLGFFECVFCINTLFGMLGGTTIVMAQHNQNILNVHYEDLPKKDKDIINKATEEFQDKCLLSYARMRDNIFA